MYYNNIKYSHVFNSTINLVYLILLALIIVLCGILYFICVSDSDVDTYEPVYYESEYEQFFFHDCENANEENRGHMLSTTDYQSNVNGFEKIHGQNSFNSTLESTMRKLDAQRESNGHKRQRLTIYSDFHSNVKLTKCEQLCLHIQLIKEVRSDYGLYRNQRHEVIYANIRSKNRSPVTSNMVLNMLGRNS